MAFSRFTNVALRAVSAVVPAQKVSLEDELAYYEGSLERARRLSSVSGLSVRRVAAEGVTASDMCLQAARTLFAESGVDTSDIGALLFVSHSPDYLLPASAAIQQHALGLSSDCATMDMNVGCAGFVKGLWVAAGLIASRACPKVLLLVGDTPNRFLDPANRVTSPVFGDAGTAALLEYREGAGDMTFLLGSNGGKHEALVIPGGGSRIPQRRDETPESPFNAKVPDAKGNPWSLGGYGQIWMDGMAIYSFGVSVVPPHIRRHLTEAGLAVNDLDKLLLHQANRVIIEGIAKKVGLEMVKVPYETLQKYGNLGSSSIPALVCEHFSASAADALAGGTEAQAPACQKRGGRERVMLCGFGAGLSWGSCLLSLADTCVLPVRDYVPPQHVPSRDERIAYWHKKFRGGDD